jgi:hypothetical protein
MTNSEVSLNGRLFFIRIVNFMTTGQIFYGGLFLVGGIWMALKALKALRAGRVLVGDSPFGNPATKANQPALYWLIVVAEMIGALVGIAAGVCAFFLWGPK